MYIWSFTARALHTTWCEQAPTHTSMGGVWDHALRSEQSPPRPPGAPHRQLTRSHGPCQARWRQLARATAARWRRRGSPYRLAGACKGRQGEHRHALARGRHVDPRTLTASQPGCRRVRCRSRRCALRRCIRSCETRRGGPWQHLNQFLHPPRSLHGAVRGASIVK